MKSSVVIEKQSMMQRLILWMWMCLPSLSDNAGKNGLFYSRRSTFSHTVCVPPEGNLCVNLQYVVVVLGLISPTFRTYLVFHEYTNQLYILYIPCICITGRCMFCKIAVSCNPMWDGPHFWHRNKNKNKKTIRMLYGYLRKSTAPSQSKEYSHWCHFVINTHYVV